MYKEKYEILELDTPQGKEKALVVFATNQLPTIYSQYLYDFYNRYEGPENQRKRK